MAKKFKINCDFGGQIAPFEVVIGKPQKGNHPLHFQADWLSKTRGGMIPGDIMDSISKLQILAEEKNVALEDLCVYALGSADEEDDEVEESEGG